MTNAVSEVKETNRTGRYSEDMRRRPVMTTFSMEFCRQEVLNQAKKLASMKEILWDSHPR